jgi:hypothetical protein
MEELMNLIVNNGIGVVCVAYLIYFQSTTMKEMLNTLNSINNRLTAIETTLDKDDKEQ